jgi:hypothetical protein
MSKILRRMISEETLAIRTRLNLEIAIEMAPLRERNLLLEEITHRLKAIQ